MVAIASAKSKGVCSKTIFPESTLAKSRISFMSAIKAAAATLMAVTYCFWVSFKAVFSTTFVNPKMAFIGVRISWLMFERNSCLAFTAFSAILVFSSALFLAIIKSFLDFT